MTCAGYLVVNNAHLAFVEMFTGVLVCFLDVDSCMDHADPSKHVLPLLETRRRAKVEVCTYMDDKLKQPESETEPQNCNKRQRLLPLSGYRVEVVDQDVDLDVPSLPCSFQVNTYKVHLHPDGSFISTLNDSLILTATNHETKEIWVKNIKLWKRFGWRETEQVAATHRDLVRLQEKLEIYNNSTLTRTYSRNSSGEDSCRDRNSAMMMYGGRSSFGASPTKRPTRRRFYRASVPGSFAPPL